MFLTDHFVPIAHQWTVHRFHVNSSHFRICVKIIRISSSKIIEMKTSKVFNFDLFQIHIIQSLWNYLIYIEISLKPIIQKCKVRSFAFEIRPSSWVITDNSFKLSALPIFLL